MVKTTWKKSYKYYRQTKTYRSRRRRRRPGVSTRPSPEIKSTKNTKKKTFDSTSDSSHKQGQSHLTTRRAQHRLPRERIISSPPTHPLLNLRPPPMIRPAIAAAAGATVPPMYEYGISVCNTQKSTPPVDRPNFKPGTLDKEGSVNAERRVCMQNRHIRCVPSRHVLAKIGYKKSVSGGVLSYHPCDTVYRVGTWDSLSRTTGGAASKSSRATHCRFYALAASHCGGRSAA